MVKEVKQKKYEFANNSFQTATKLNPFNGYALFLYGSNTIVSLKDDTKYKNSLKILNKALKYLNIGTSVLSIF